LPTKNPLHPQQQLPPPKQNPHQQINTLNQFTHPQTNTEKPLLNTSQTTTQLPSQLPKPKQLNNLIQQLNNLINPKNQIINNTKFINQHPNQQQPYSNPIPTPQLLKNKSQNPQLHKLTIQQPINNINS
ncbi:GA module-containing protein, partial [Staphylococcus epidermidis]|uniref:GA module-containing protein n=1 Tax=Staphylococcus epidermidis TaxID=1282 RepID=UPI0011A75706